MAPRANWKGYLRLSLVSCPIALYPASSLSEKVSFNRINRKTGNRLKQQNVDTETGDVVPREDTARGFEVAKGQYLIVEDQEIDAVQIESTRTIEIDQFVPRSEIDDRYIDSPYYIAPDGKVVRQVKMPDVYPTNICFGGRDMKTAYITLSGTGQLAATDWPEPGLRLNFQE